MLPWVSAQRERLKDPTDLFPQGDPMADDYLDCGACRRMTSRAQRAGMACGWMPESERTGYEFMHPDGAPEDIKVCPGYTVNLPEVNEAARALSWRQDGQLTEFYDGEKPTRPLRDAMDLIAAESKRVERHSLRETKKRRQD